MPCPLYTVTITNHILKQGPVPYRTTIQDTLTAAQICNVLIINDVFPIKKKRKKKKTISCSQSSLNLLPDAQCSQEDSSAHFSRLSSVQPYFRIVILALVNGECRPENSFVVAC